MHQKDVDGMANSVNPDQTAPRPFIMVYHYGKFSSGKANSADPNELLFIMPVLAGTM